MNNSELLKSSRTFIESQAESVALLLNCIDDNFIEAVNLISDSGRLLVSGIGKAGYAAKKVSSTFSSIGIPSFFLHPTEAFHGDFGKCSSGDKVILFSHSGETSELCLLAETLRQFDVNIVAITSNYESTLARHSDLIISYGQIAEAGPLGLAPTTSVTLMLILGDALAMAVAKKNHLTKDKFSKFHPGGALGRKLTIVTEIMRKDERHCIVGEDTITREVIKQYTVTPGRPGAATIVTATGKLAGIFTDGNLRRCIDNGIDFLDSPISEVMTKAPMTLSASETAKDALERLTARKIDQLIVVDEGNTPIGLVDIQDLVAFL
jgi:arabinose-5-phosphate isomerase